MPPPEAIRAEIARLAASRTLLECRRYVPPNAGVADAGDESLPCECVICTEITRLELLLETPGESANRELLFASQHAVAVMRNWIQPRQEPSPARLDVFEAAERLEKAIQQVKP